MAGTLRTVTLLALTIVLSVVIQSLVMITFILNYEPHLRSIRGKYFERSAVKHMLLSTNLSYISILPRPEAQTPPPAARSFPQATSATLLLRTMRNGTRYEAEAKSAPDFPWENQTHAVSAEQGGIDDNPSAPRFVVISCVREPPWPNASSEEVSADASHSPPLDSVFTRCHCALQTAGQRPVERQRRQRRKSMLAST